MRLAALAPALALIAAFASCDRPEATGPPRGDGYRPGVSEVPPVEEAKVVAGQTIYVPAYSHVYTGDEARPLNLATSLFVRNTDPGRPIVVSRVGYFDSGGKPIREFVKGPLKVQPMASAEFFIKEGDLTGGASPSFVVEWVATEAGSDPVAEAVMIGTAGTQGISFTSPGRVTASRRQ